MYPSIKTEYLTHGHPCLSLIHILNIDEDMDLALKYGVQAVPTVVIIKNGEIYSRMVGVADKKSLTDALDGAIQD